MTDSDVEELAQEPTDMTNKSVIKAGALLRELGRHPQGITVTELAQAVRMTRPTAFRLLLTLEQIGFVDRDDNLYKLGFEIARLGRLADPISGLAARLQPILDDLAADLNESIGFAIVNGDLDYDLVAESSGSRILNVPQQYIGRKYPLHASATGKILLAELSDEKIAEVMPDMLESFTRHTINRRSDLIREIHEVRKQGYATLDNELEEGLFTVGCGVRDISGRLTGVITANGPGERLRTGRLPATVERLRQAADEIAKAIL
ncbi:transcriptional regulator, IclR family [Arthrobacter sp. ok909]|nr:transcriptional regulator, IclR family [Arthrobacter sp. ok909]